MIFVQSKYYFIIYLYFLFILILHRKTLIVFYQYLYSYEVIYNALLTDGLVFGKIGIKTFHITN